MPLDSQLSDRGQSTVEFALVILVLLLLFLAIFDLGRGIFKYNLISNAVREAARFGIVLPQTGTSATDTDRRNRICRVAIHAATLPNVPANLASLTCNPSSSGLPVIAVGLDELRVQATLGSRADPANGVVASPIQVTIEYAFRPVSSGFLNVANPITMRTSSTMNVE